jgi:putative hydroxymethylpyrimidine transport system ATP-binding protein
MNSAPSIIIENISLRYQEHLLFDHLNCRLQGGQFSCIIGPSGVGKSTLLRLIAALDHSQLLSGRIYAEDQKPLSGRVSYMAQADSLMPWLSVLDNVLIGYRLRGEHTALLREQAMSLLAKVGLAKVALLRPDALSGGMRQRAALARTLLEDRPIVLMDEPFSALDAITRLQLQELAAELLVGRTVLLVTHDPLEALRLGHVVYVMAGLPAQLQLALSLPGSLPRDPTAPNLLTHHAELLHQLRRAVMI